MLFYKYNFYFFNFCLNVFEKFSNISIYLSNFILKFSQIFSKIISQKRLNLNYIFQNFFNSIKKIIFIMEIRQ